MYFLDLFKSNQIKSKKKNIFYSFKNYLLTSKKPKLKPHTTINHKKI
jgi:hypothetical protein